MLPERPGQAAFVAIDVTMQGVIDRYARALSVPLLMLDLFPTPRPQGAPEKKYRTINPAVVLASISAFEGFAEELVATMLYNDGHPMAYIAHNSNLTNPTVGDLEKLLTKTCGLRQGDAAKGFTATIMPPPAPDATTTWWLPKDITWSQLVTDSTDWMQVRHNLTHGTVTGLEPARWPGPANNSKDAGLASNVLQTMKDGRHSLNFWGAITCARIYSQGATRLATLLAASRSETVDTSKVPDFLDV